ncbi:MAG: hypothetical protein QW520_02040 [Methanomassiliicoccales archaeon]
MNPAVILSMGASGLGVARSLASQGIPIIGMDFDIYAPGFHSRFVDGRQCPDPVTSPEELLAQLMHLGEELRDVGVLFPCSDAFLLFVSRNRERLARHFAFVLPERSVVEGLVYKRYQYEWAERLGVPIPETFYPRDMSEVVKIESLLRYPAFIKGHYSHLWARVFGNKGFIVRTPQELEARFSQVLAAGLEGMVQRIVMPPGENFAAVGAYISPNGRIQASVTWQKLRQTPPNFGIGTLLLSKRLPEVEETAMRYMRGIGFAGIGVIGFKRDLEDGEWKMIEINGRPWFQIYFATRCGINLPLLYYLDALKLEPPVMNGFKEGLRFWNPLDDFDSFIRLRRRGRLTLADWIRSWFIPDVLPYYERGDVRPALTQANYGLNWMKRFIQTMRDRRDEDAL